MTGGLKVHPAADVFPMLNDDELNELAADIKANGLIHPIVVKDGVLIDGRNRMEACKRAGVEPQFAELNGADPAAYILSSNINRRHMTKGQRAMAVAMIYPDADENKGGRGKKSAANTSAKLGGFSMDRVDQARTVLKYLPVMADEVLRGKSLDEAYAEAQREKMRADSFDERLAKIEAEAPDMASRVRDETLSIEAAETEVRVRRDRESARIAGFTKAIESFASSLDAVLTKRDDDTITYLLAQAAIGADARTLQNADTVLRNLRGKAQLFLDRTGN